MSTFINRTVRLAALAALLGFAVAGLGQQEPRKDDPLEAVALKGTPIHAIALAANGDILAATNKGLWRVSSDGRSEAAMPGTGLPRPMDKCFISDVKISPGGDVFIISGADGNNRGRDGIYRWSAKGSGWQLVGSNLLPLKIETERIAALAITPDGALVAAATVTSGMVGHSKVFRLYRSTNMGEAWQEMTHGQKWTNVYFITPGPQGQVWLGGGWAPGWYYVLIADEGRAPTPAWRPSFINPKEKEDLKGEYNHIAKVAFDSMGNAYALVTYGTPRTEQYSHGVYRSADKGATWQRLTESNISADLWSLAINPDNHIYYSTHGGLRRSLDGGKTWQDFASLGSTWVSGMLFDQKGHLWAGSDGFGRSGFGNHGLFRSKQPVGKGVGTSTTTVIEPPPPPPPLDGMTLLAERRRVKAGETVIVPVWLLKGKDVANMNFTTAYDPKVAVSAGPIIRGNLLGNALFESNPAESGLMRIGYAQSTGISGDGTVASLPFRAVGKPGEQTELHLEVTTINSSAGAKPQIHKVHGEILIVGSDDQVPGDCDGDGAITAADARCALQMSVRLRPESLHMDADSDKQVTSNDARLILRKVVGK